MNRLYFIAAAITDRGYGWIHASPENVTDPVAVAALTAEGAL